MQELNNQIPEYLLKDDGSAYSKHPEDEVVSFVEDGLPNKYCNFCVNMDSMCLTTP